MQGTENILDVLMFIYRNYMDDDASFAKDMETVYSELKTVGFQMTDIEQAMQWLENLYALKVSLGKDDFTHSTRIYNDYECNKLPLAARQFLTHLEQIKVLDPATREIIIDRALAIHEGVISPSDVKWVALMVLFHLPEKKPELAWLENHILNDNLINQLH